MQEEKLFTKDKAGNFRVIRTARAAKEAGIDDIGNFYLDSMLEGLTDIAKTHEENLQEQTQVEQNELYPPGFIPYNDIWKYEPVPSNFFCKKFLDFNPSDKQQEVIDVICDKDPFKFTDERYEEADVMWGKRSGKDTIISIAIVYQAYKLACLFDPHKFVGFGPGSIDIINVASNAEQAQNVFFNYLATFVKRAKDPDTKRNWFVTRNFWWDVGKGKFVYMDLREKDGHIKKKQIEFGRGIVCHSLTSERFTAEGLNILLAIMDELGAMRPEKVFGSTEKMIGQYDSLSATARSTSTMGYGKMVVMSYKYGPNCPMTMLMKRNKRDAKKFCKVYSVYEVRTDVPEEKLRNMFATEYVKDPEKAAMMYECKDPKTELESLYSNLYIIDKCFDEGRKFSVNPIIGGMVTVNNIHEGIDKLFEKWFVGNQNHYNCVHLDLAKGRTFRKQDAAALCMGHIEEMRVMYDKFLIDYYKKNYGIDLAEFDGQLRMGIVVDVAIQIVCTPEQGEVQLADIRKCVIDLHKKRKFQIFKVTVDGWQSTETIQEFNRSGLEAELLSVDKTPAAHHTLKDFVQMGLFKIYKNGVWRREAKEIQDLGNKIDHPELSAERFEQEGCEHGSKDLIDCTAGVAYVLSSEIDMGGDVFFK